MTDFSCKLLVIGAGPGGYVCAIRAGQLGVDTIIVEAAKPGGTCLNIGCIPSKALIHAADEFHRLHEFVDNAPLGISASSPAIDFGRTLAWKDQIVSRLNSGVSGLLKKAKVRSITGQATFIDGKTVRVDSPGDGHTIHAQMIVIATGSTPVELPTLPFAGNVMSSTEALSLTEVPKRLAVVGGGYIGLELGTAYAKLGSQVTVIETASRILPQYDKELTGPVSSRLTALGIKVLTEAKAVGLASENELLIDTPSGQQKLPIDKVLVTVGRKPRTTGWGLEKLSLGMSGPFIKIDATCRTSMNGVYAIGDVTGEPMLAHRAMAQGEMVAEIAAGHRIQWDRRCIPAVCFTDPEIVSVGMLPSEAVASGIEIINASFPFQANGRAMTTGREDGFIRVVARADNHLLLGLQGVGASISELSAAFALLIETGARLEDVVGTIHAHPTQGEALQEACLRGLGRAIHL